MIESIISNRQHVLAAGKLFTDARTKDCKSYPKQCVRHFEFDNPFHSVLLKNVTLFTVSSQTMGCLLVSCLPMLKQRTAKLTPKQYV